MIEHYTYRQFWHQPDNEYVGVCEEFPSLSWLADNPQEALQGIQAVVADVVADLEANGETAPSVNSAVTVSSVSPTTLGRSTLIPA